MNKKITSKHYSTDWPIELFDKNSNKWDYGIEIIEDRFMSRFINPMNELINHKSKEISTNSGFVIMAVDCLLIETLNQFYFGLKSSNKKYYRENTNKNYRFISQAFRDFFNYSTFFPDFKNNEELQKIFYNDIRNGLLHQAESKVNSLINIKNKKMIVPIDGRKFENGIVINRNLFHKAINNEFVRYINDLKNPSSINLDGENLREMCHKKMINLI
jgi:hypothetical protein